VKYALGHRAMGYYEIIVASCIDKKRARDFLGMDIKHIENGKTLLSGKLADQAALFCVISKIRDMNLTLISIKRNDEEMEMKP
jgi:hypothetical protein